MKARKLLLALAMVFMVTTGSLCKTNRDHSNGQPTSNPVLYGARGNYYFGSLYRIDPATGNATLIGDTGENVTGLAVHPTTGVMYGSTTSDSTNSDALITIDPNTGASTLIGAHGFGPIIDLTFASDGTLYGWSEDSDDLVTVDIATGAATVVGNSALGTAGSGLDMAPDGTLYLFGNTPGGIYIINRTTGAAAFHQALSLAESCPGGSHSPGGVLHALYITDGDGGRNLVTINTATGTVAVIGATAAWLSGLAWNPLSSVLYGVQGNLPNGLPGFLYRIDAATGAATFIGDIGETVTGMAMHPTTKVLYGSTTSDSLNSDALITIDPNTGASTLIGAHGFGPIIDLTFASDGTLYGWSEDSDDLVTVDISTGVATVVGDSGLGTSGSGLDMAPDGTIYLFGANPGGIYTIDRMTGAATFHQNLTSTDACPGGSHNQSTGVLYALFMPVWSGPQRNLCTIDTGTGAVTVVGLTANGLSALAWSAQ